MSVSSVASALAARTVKHPARSMVESVVPPGPSPLGATLARLAGSGMLIVLVAVDLPAGAAIWVWPTIALAWLLLSSALILRRGWSRTQARMVGVVDLAVVIGAIAVTGGTDSTALRVLWLMPLAWAVVTDAATVRLLLVLAGLAFLAFWVPHAIDGDSGVVRDLATFGSPYLASTAVALVALRLRAEAVEHTERLTRARTALTRELGQVEREERERLSIQIHDGALQMVISARQDVEDSVEGDPEALEIAVRTLDESISSLRDVAADLYPDQDAGSSVSDQVHAIARAWESRSDFQVRVNVDERVGASTDAMLVGMVGELVGNAAKHASPSLVFIRLRDSGTETIVEVADDGCGMLPAHRVAAEQAGHIGLRSLDRRVRAIGGKWRIRSAPDQGTVVQLELPH